MGKYVLVSIDYHTRMIWGTVLEEKRASLVVDYLTKLCRKGRKPKEIITDNGKEFANEELRIFCERLSINHRKISVESHRSNGRVERVIQTLRESILKAKEGKFEDIVKDSIRMYNNSFHVGLGCTPTEAIKDTTGQVMIENGPEGSYSSRFVARTREKFLKGQHVRVAKKENLHGCDKYSKGRFLDLGRVIECCEGDSYIVKLRNGRYVKKRHYDLKDLLGCEGNK